MSLIGTLIQKGARFGAWPDQPRLTPAEHQQLQLLSLLKQARHTAFGRYYHFSGLENAGRQLMRAYGEQVPAMDYNQIYQRWWSRTHVNDAPDICWPGHTPYFALSSGTSQAATKYIPVTPAMLRSIKHVSRRIFCEAARFDLPGHVFSRKMLMVGSCTTVRREGGHFSGDVSGILGHNRPLWMESYYRPGRDITDLPEWGERIERIVEAAPRWDIGFAVGNPMWLQMILERIVERYQLDHIHELWPNFAFYVHGGVFFEPYRPALETLFKSKVHYMNSYLASEGFFAYQKRPGDPTQRFLPDCGIFFEFVPFNEKNFDENGDLRHDHPETYTLATAQEDQTYAVLISTCAGAWRYLVGDTIRFTDVARGEFHLTGRTKQFLSVCGEHISIDNLNAAVERVNQQLRAGIREFTVAGLREGSNWAHQWYVSVENYAIPAAMLASALDTELKRLNDDYAIERQYVLKDVRVEILPQASFLNWLDHRGKMNGQAKIPRVLKGEHLVDFEQFIKGSTVAGKTPV